MELAAPITVFWDLAPAVAAGGQLDRICDEIIACRPLMLQLNDPSPQMGEGTRMILKRLANEPVSVFLTITPACLQTLGITAVSDLDVRELLLAAEQPGDVSDAPAVTGLGVSCAVTRENWRTLPDVVCVCRERGFLHLVFPMQRLYHGEVPFLLSRYEQIDLEHVMAAAGGTQGVNLTIHDPFLWRAFNPGVPFPQGGCQAGNTMIAISSEGGVYPCPTLPQMLGNLGTTSLKQIITSPSKKEFRRSLLDFPTACRQCHQLDECRGGCRGRAFVMHGSLDGIDPACQ